MSLSGETYSEVTATVTLSVSEWSDVLYALARFGLTAEEEKKLPKARAIALLRSVDSQVAEAFHVAKR